MGSVGARSQDLRDGGGEDTGGEKTRSHCKDGRVRTSSRRAYKGGVEGNEEREVVKMMKIIGLNKVRPALWGKKRNERGIEGKLVKVGDVRNEINQGKITSLCQDGMMSI